MHAQRRFSASLVVTVAISVLPVRGEASDVGDELTVGSSKPAGATATNTGTSSFISDSVISSFDLGEKWSIDPGFVWSVSKDTTTSPPTTSTTTTLLGSLLVSFSPNDNWMFLGSLKYSPPSANPGFSMELRYRDPTTQQRITFLANSETISSLGVGLGVGYDSAGDRNVEWGVDFDPSFTAYGITFSGIEYAGTTNETPATLKPRINQFRFGGAATLHLFDRVDAAAKGAVYYYTDRSHSPTYALIKYLGQATGGLPISPMDWEVGPAATVYFLRRLYLSLNTTAGPYVDPCQGFTMLGTLKLTGRPGPVKVWGLVTLQLDTPPQDPATVSSLNCNNDPPSVNPPSGTPTPPSVSSYIGVGGEFIW